MAHEGDLVANLLNFPKTQVLTSQFVGPLHTYEGFCDKLDGGVFAEANLLSSIECAEL